MLPLSDEPPSDSNQKRLTISHIPIILRHYEIENGFQFRTA